MQAKIEQHDRLTILHLSGDLTIPYAKELKYTLLETIVGNDKLEVNLSQVSDLDTAGLQLLIMAKQEALSKNKEMHLTSHSSVVIEALETTHLDAYFGDPLVLSS